jgi:hypothetical protein
MSWRRITWPDLEACAVKASSSRMQRISRRRQREGLTMVFQVRAGYAVPRARSDSAAGWRSKRRDSVATARSSAFRAPRSSAGRRTLRIPWISPATTICLGALMLATNTGRSLLLTLATTLAVCGSFKPTIAASPYPVGRVCTGQRLVQYEARWARLKLRPSPAA